MKFFKIAAATLGILIGVILIGVFIFIKTFDINAHLPQITKAASQAMGQDLSIQNAGLDLSFKGLLLNCQGIAISDLKKNQGPLVKIAKAQVGVDLLPFLTTRKLNFKQIDISDIRVHVADPKMPLDISIPQMRARAQDFSLTDIYHVQLDFVFASLSPNVHVNTEVQLDPAHGKVTVSNMALKSDLAQLNMNDIRNISPTLKSDPLPLSVSGELKVDVMRLVFGAKGLEDVQAHVTLENAGAKLKEILTPISKSRFEADIDLNKINLREFHIHIGEGSINGQAEIGNYMNIAQIQSKGNIDRIKVEDLVDVNTLPVILKGNINASGGLSAQSFDPVIISKTLRGEGEFNITEGTIEKLNIVKSVLGPTLGLIPGLAEGVDSLISGVVKNQIADVTVLDKASARFKVRDQIVSIDDGLVQTKPFALTAKGTVHLDMLTDIQADIFLSKDISDQITAKVEQLGYLRDESGRVKISGTIQGVIPALGFKPNVDVKATAQNALIEEGSKQLQKVIEKNPEVGNIINSVFGKTAEQDPNAPVSTKDSKEKAKNAIGNVLNSILK